MLLKLLESWKINFNRCKSIISQSNQPFKGVMGFISLLYRSVLRGLVHSSNIKQGVCKKTSIFIVTNPRPQFLTTDQTTTKLTLRSHVRSYLIEYGLLLSSGHGEASWWRQFLTGGMICHFDRLSPWPSSIVQHRMRWIRWEAEADGIVRMGEDKTQTGCLFGGELRKLPTIQAGGRG